MRALSLTVLALSACSAAPPPPEPPYPIKGEISGALCDGRDLAVFAGRPATQELGARMLAASGARVLRWVQEGRMITMEYSAERLTVHLTKANTIEQAVCG